MSEKEAKEYAASLNKEAEHTRYDDVFRAEQIEAGDGPRWVVTRSRPGEPDMRVAG